MRRAFLLTWALLVAAISIAPAATQQGDWTLYKVGGRDYVSVENIAEFYALGDVQQTSNDFLLKGALRSLRGQANSVEFYINNLKFNLSYPVAECSGHLCVSRMDLTKLIEPVMRPGRIKDADKIDTVVLDAGHGGQDNGAYSPFGYEKTFTLDVVNRARILFLQAGFKVILTRSTDSFISLYDRVKIANRQQNALFLSVHFNAGGAGTGLETYTLSPRGVPSMAADGPSVTDLVALPGHINDSENIALATATHASMVVRSRMYDRGIKRARFVVIRDITIPGVLVEGGFLTNMNDAKLIATPAYRQQMAASLLQAVQNYRRAVGSQSQTVAAQQPKVITTPETIQPPVSADNPDGPRVITPTAN